MCNIYCFIRENGYYFYIWQPASLDIAGLYRHENWQIEDKTTWIIDSYIADEMDVKTNLAMLLYKTRSIFRWNSRKGKQQAPYFFIHVPKTAGTSFRYLLYQQFDQKSIFPNMSDIARNGGRYPVLQEIQQIKPEKIKTIKLLAGHYPVCAGAVFKTAPKMLIFLREPVARTLSSIIHLQTHAPALRDKGLAYIYEHAKSEILNLQVRFLSDPFVSLDAPVYDLDEAKENLAKCSFIGISEIFKESVRLAEQMFDWRFFGTFRLNASKYGNKQFDPALVARITEESEKDIALYQYGLELFEDMKKKYGV